jgi:hypothetical protein
MKYILLFVIQLNVINIIRVYSLLYNRDIFLYILFECCILYIETRNIIQVHHLMPFHVALHWLFHRRRRCFVLFF